MVPIVNKGSVTAIREGTIYVLVENAGRWKLQNARGHEYTARGRFNFIRRNGVFRVSKRGEHIHISGGLPVDYAGEVRFGYNNVGRGQLRSWSNASGHYEPPVALAAQACLPMVLFIPIAGVP